MLKHSDQTKMLEISQLCNFKQNNPIGNYLGIMGEYSELLVAISEINRNEIEDALTDIYVFLLNLTNDLSISLPILKDEESIKHDNILLSPEEDIFAIYAGALGSLLGKHLGYIKTKPKDKDRNFLLEINSQVKLLYCSLKRLSILFNVNLSISLDKVIEILKARHVSANLIDK